MFSTLIRQIECRCLCPLLESDWTANEKHKNNTGGIGAYDSIIAGRAYYEAIYALHSQAIEHVVCPNSLTRMGNHGHRS